MLKTRLKTFVLKHSFRSPLPYMSTFLLLLVAQGSFADFMNFSTDDTVSITAENAWEDDKANVIHFSGKFELRAPDWYLSADSAVVYGDLDNPDKVVLKGKPAKIYFLRDTNDQTKQGNDSSSNKQSVEGEASRIEYYRATNKLRMQGSASLRRKDNKLASEIIEYDVDADRYSASGEGGINIQLNPSEG